MSRFSLTAEESRDIVANARTHGGLLQVDLTPLITAYSHFFTPDEIEFDLNPTELRDQADLDALIAFVLTIGRALDHPAYVGVEASHPRPPEDLRYDWHRPRPHRSLACSGVCETRLVGP